jgi:hypothetical protein
MRRTSRPLSASRPNPELIDGWQGGSRTKAGAARGVCDVATVTDPAELESENEDGD